VATVAAKSNLAHEPTGASTHDRGAIGSDCLAAPRDIDQIPSVMKARLQLVPPPPLIFLRGRPTHKVIPDPVVNHSDLLSAGIALIEARVNVIPVKDNKKPALKEWTPFQSRRTTITELEKWCKKKSVYGLAMVGGKISGGHVVLDIDVAQCLELFLEAVKRNQEVRELANLLPIQQTGSGNYQMAFRLWAIPSIR
jgi:hypothetical protein